MRCSVGVLDVLELLGGEMVKQVILDTVDDLVGQFLYYDREEDEDLPLGVIEQNIKDGVITQEEVVEKFKERLKECL